MPVVSDYTVIRGDAEGQVTPGNPGNWTFNTGGRRSNGEVILMVSLRSFGEPNDAPVRVNNTLVGHLRNYHDEDARNWHTQQILFPAGTLNDGNNTLQIATSSGDLVLGGVVCHFKQMA